MRIVETEFLFGLRKSDKRHLQVSKIIELHKDRRIDTLFCAASAFLEVAVVLQSQGFTPERIQEALFLMKQKMEETNIAEVELDSDDLIRLYELLRQHDITYFDAMQAAVALGRNATLITNDETFKQVNVKTLSFQALIKKAEKERVMKGEEER